MLRVVVLRTLSPFGDRTSPAELQRNVLTALEWPAGLMIVRPRRHQRLGPSRLDWGLRAEIGHERQRHTQEAQRHRPRQHILRGSSHRLRSSIAHAIAISRGVRVGNPHVLAERARDPYVDWVSQASPPVASSRARTNAGSSSVPSETSRNHASETPYFAATIDSRACPSNCP